MDNNYALISYIVPSNIVQKSRSLLMMKDVPFDFGELRVLETYLSRINSHDENHRTVEFTKAEYLKLMELKDCRISVLKKYTKHMLGKVVEVPFYPDDNGNFDRNPDHYKQISLFEEAEYTTNSFGESVIRLTCTTAAKRILFNIDNIGYLQYELSNVLKLTSIHSYFLYLYLKDNRFRRDWVVDINDLRRQLFLSNHKTYSEFKYFKRDILVKALNEINEKTDIQFSYDTIKHCRNVTAIHFTAETIADKIAAQADTIEPEQQLSLLDEQEEKVIDYGSDLADLLGSAACNDEFDPKQIRVIQDLVLKATHTRDHMELCDFLIHRMHLMEYRNSQQPIHDRFSYLCTMLRNEIEKQ